MRKTNLFSQVVDLVESNHPLLIVSDLDDTLTTEYDFDARTNTHTPKFREQLAQLVRDLSQRHHIPFIIATARGVNDGAVGTIAAFSGHPVLLENGGVCLIDDRMEVIATKEELKNLEEIKNFLATKFITLKKFFSEQNLELLIRTNRRTSIEFRLQKTNGQGISQEELHFYRHIMQELEAEMESKQDHLKFIEGISSLSIAPRSVSKRDGMNYLLERKFSSIKPKLISFGDSINDSELLDFSDLAFSVGPQKIGKTVHLPGNDQSVIQVLDILQEVLNEKNSI